MRIKALLVYIFISCFSAFQNFAQNPTLSWALKAGGAGGTYYRKMAVDGAGYSVHSISFNGLTDLDPGPGVQNYTGVGGGDVGLIKLDPSGNTVWTRQIGGPFYERASAITIDASGNIFVCGFFASTADFDPGAGVANLTSTGPYNGFILKLDVNGNFVWVQQIKTSNLFDIKEVLVSASGQIYTLGQFDGTIDLDPGTGTYSATASNIDVYIATYDVAGNFVWAKIFAGSGSDGCDAMTFDPATSDLIVLVTFIGTCDFDPGAGVFNLTSALYTTCILRLSSTGVFGWAKMFTSSGAIHGSDLRVNTSGDIWISGYITGNADLDPDAGTFPMSSPALGIQNSVFIKLNSTGNFITAAKVDGAASNYSTSLVINNSNGDLYACGAFKGIADLDPGAGVMNINSIGNQGWYVVQLQTNGNYIWGGGSGGDYYTEAADIGLDLSSNIYVGGHFYNTVDFNPDNSLTTNLVSSGLPDPFFLRFNRSTLPVSFLYFSGRMENKFVELEWSTASEINNSYFTIERSSDGRNYTQCGVVEGNGTTSNLSEYNFTDVSAPKGIVYYSLSQTDYDGTAKNLSTIALENTSDDNFYVSTFEKDNRIIILSPEKGEFLLQLISMSGKIVYSKVVEFGSGKNVELYSDLFSSGIYVLTVKNEKRHYSKKVVL